MASRLLVPLACALAIVAVPPVAHAEVYQCAGPDGGLLLTDRACPAGYQTRFVVREVRREPPAAAPVEPAPVPPRATSSDVQRLGAAEAEADLLREQLELERLRRELIQEQLRLADRELETRYDDTIGYSITGPILVPRYPIWHEKRGRPGKPCVDCDGAGGKVEYKPRDRWRDCGTFGCTPTITHAPSDSAGRTRDRGPAARPAGQPSRARSDARPVSMRAARP